MTTNILIGLLCALTLLIVYWIAFGYYKITISGKLVKEAIPYSLPGTDYRKTILVLGDSTAVGVGASTSTDSIPAKLASYLGATFVENHAVSGSLVLDIPAQISLMQLDHYDTIILQIGANDIVRFHGIEKIEKQLEPILTTLSKKAYRVIFISAGNLGGAPIIPPPLRPFYTRLNLRYHEHFEILAKKYKVHYINMYQDPKNDPFVKEPTIYFAEDSFHPSSRGYEIWFKLIMNQLLK